MRSIQKKLLLYIIIMGVIPMLFFTFYYYDLSLDKATEKLNSESQSVLEQLDNKLAVRVSRLQNTADVILDDAELYRILRETGSSDAANSEAQKKLNDIFDKFSRSERDIASIILMPVGGGTYLAGEPLSEKDTVRFVLQYDNVGMNAGVLSWLGLKEQSGAADKEVIVAATMLRDARYVKDQAYLATVYLIFHDTLFGDGSVSAEGAAEGAVPPAPANPQIESISVYDGGARLIYASGNKRLSDIFIESSVAIGLRVYDSDTGSFPITMDEEQYMVIYHTSPITGWKLVKTVPYERYFEGQQYIGYLTAAFFLLMFALWYAVNYFVIRRMTTPIRELVGAMKQVGAENFDIELKVRTKDEFGIISSGFNSMVVRIKSLFERTRQEEEKRRRQDILMLRYQMNPHFLYNTLGAIRLAAIASKQEKIAQMLLILGRFLRNAILTANELLDIRSEIDNIRDYISLYQLRYNNRLQVSIDAAEDCYHYLIPSMLCQPIIENAIMHGLSDRIDSGEEAKIEVRIRAEQDDLRITVYDNGLGISEEKIQQIFEAAAEQSKRTRQDRLHIGLQNIHNRIKLIFGPDYGITVESKEGEYTQVTLKLPKKSTQ